MGLDRNENGAHINNQKKKLLLFFGVYVYLYIQEDWKSSIKLKIMENNNNNVLSNFDDQQLEVTPKEKKEEERCLDGSANFLNKT